MKLSMLMSMADRLDETFQKLHGFQPYNQISCAYRALKRWATATIFLFFILLLVGAFIIRIDFSIITRRPKNSIGFRLKCSNKGLAKTYKANNYTVAFENTPELSDASCPEYFRWIHEDLRPWKSTGISRDTLERAKNLTNFRLVIVEGKAYVEKYQKSFQTRDLFTIWGILQLLRLYPGRVPDLELMFRCGDIPLIRKRDYQGPNATSPPALFQYCGHDNAFAIVFPDWSFWGWAEINIRPWESMVKRIIKGSKKMKWKNRVPYAYWKGNPNVSPNRRDLMTCNVSDKHDWNARLYKQDWHQEIQQGYKHSKLEDQCTHRYKIYVEGRGWSVSDKYILACDSMTLLIKPEYYDFFMRSMVPMEHYWPIRTTDKCRDIEFAVEWGNKHPHKAKVIGKTGSKFIQENLKMEYVYAYMFHTLREYAKLLKFKPEIPKGGVEVCLESMVCLEKGIIERKFMEESMVNSPSDALPCSIPPPYDHPTLHAIFDRKENITKQVVMWENEYWQNLHNTQSMPLY